MKEKLEKRVDLKLFDIGDYNHGSLIKRILWSFVSSLFFKNSIFISYSLKRFFLRIFGSKIGNNVIIKPNVNIKYPWNLEIDSNSWIGENVWIDNLDKVIISCDVCISQGVYIFNGNHNYKEKTFDLFTKKVKIEEGVWIGAKSIICPGITCAKYSVISVGSVITKNTTSNGVYFGNPARKIKERFL